MKRKSLHGFRLLRCRFCTQQQTKHKQQPYIKPYSSPSSAQLSLESYMRSASSRSSLENVSFSETWSLFVASVCKSYRESSMFSKLFYGSFISLVLFGDCLDRRTIEYRNPNGVYSFLSESPEETIMDLCRTGDIMVFQRPILSFNPLNMLRTSLRQFACGGPYDHCALIVHNKYDNDHPYCVEIDANYRNKLRITPFDERVLTAREASIFVRQIHKANIEQETINKWSDWIDFKANGFDENNHNKQYIDEIEQFITEKTSGRDSILRLLMTLCFNGDNTVKIRSSIRDLTRKIRQNQYEITTQIKSKTNSSTNLLNVNANAHRRHHRVKNIDHLIKETRILKLQRVLKKDNLKKRQQYVRNGMRINSSEFVGYFWRFLGVLSVDGAKPAEIRPQHFADSKLEIPMMGTTRLGHVQFVKTQNETHKINDYDHQRRYRTSKLNKWEQKERKQN